MVLSWEYHCLAYLVVDTHRIPYYVQVKSLTRMLDQLQGHRAQLGVPLPGLPAS
jgi:hypothetical protein